MSAIAPAVYLLCLGSSAVCAWLLIRSYTKNKSRLLLWSAVCFFLLAVNNFLVVADIMLVPSIDLIMVRQLASLGAVLILLYGFIWEVE